MTSAIPNMPTDVEEGLISQLLKLLKLVNCDDH